MFKPYPLVLEPILLEKVWGGRRLERFNKRLPPAEGKLIGESWEVADLASTSPSGGGGAAARSVILNGPLAGKTLHEALAMWGTGLIGNATPAPDNSYPLLVKLLDARENLSVQVHPSPAYAAARAGAHLKSECWYILEAEPGSLIYKGTKPGVSREKFAADIASGAVVNDLVAVPAVAGECHNLPSGTVHALGAGVLVAEVQTPSDTTFRVYDWGRTGRELHVEQALECIDFGPAPGTTKWRPEDARARAVTLASTEYFTINEVLTEDRTFESCDVLIAIKGSGTIGAAGTRRFKPVRVEAGTTAVIPCGLERGWAIEPEEGGLRYLAVQLGRPGAGS